MPGSASGVDTRELVRKLVEIEKAPLARHENSKKELGQTNNALTELRKRARTLQDTLKVLNGFEAGFEHKKLLTTPAGYVDAIVNKRATPGKHKIQVLKLAQNLSFSSAEIDPEQKLIPAQFSINTIKGDFKGGTIGALKDYLNKKYKDLLTAKIVTVKEKSALLVIESKTPGEDGYLSIDDTSGLLASIELVSSGGVKPIAKPQPEKQKKNEDPGEPASPEKREETVPLLLFPDKITVLKEGPAEIASDLKGITLSSGAIRRYSSLVEDTAEKKLKAIVLNAEVQKADLEKTQKDDAPYSLTDGPVDKLNIKGIELNSYNITRTRPVPDIKTIEHDYGIRIQYFTGKEETISLKDKPGLSQTELKEPVKAIDFYTSDLQVKFSNPQWVYEVTDKPKPLPKSQPEKQPDALPTANKQKGDFPHLIKSAENAHLKLDDIDIKRKSNNNLTDVLDGVTLNLMKAGSDVIEAEITNDNQKAKEQILAFVKAYNELLLFSDEAAKAAKTGEVGKYKEMKTETGILSANATVRSLVNGLKVHVSNAYPALREPELKTLPAIGISTGAVGAKWEEISKGYLVVDENKLNEMLAAYPLAVKELFAIDSNGDQRTDNGFAFVTENFIEPYARFTGGIITAQIKNNQERLKQLDREIKRVEEHAKAYETRMKTKFSYMESNIQKQKSTGNFLKQKLGNQGRD